MLYFLKNSLRGVVLAVAVILTFTGFSSTIEGADAVGPMLVECDPLTSPYCHETPWSPPGGTCRDNTCDSQSQICCI